jgi:uncharacterized membrane protein
MQLSSRFVAFTAATGALTVGLSLLTIPFVFGTGIHFFQAGILLASVAGGPLSGLIVGSVGGLYMAGVRSDPTIVIGNGLLGLFAGAFSSRFRPLYAGVAAWVLVQAPWIYIIDTFVYHLPATVIQTILTLLTIEAVVCASVVDVIANHFHLKDFFLNHVRHQ